MHGWHHNGQQAHGDRRQAESNDAFDETCEHEYGADEDENWVEHERTLIDWRTARNAEVSKLGFG